MCVLPPGHPLAAKEILTPEDFHSENYISLSRTDSYRQLLDQLFTEHQVKRRMIVETHSAASVCAMVRAGVGVSVVNPLTALDYAASGLVVRRFSIAVPFTVSLIRPLHRPSSALVQAFSEHLQAGLPKLVTSLDAIFVVSYDSIKATASSAWIAAVSNTGKTLRSSGTSKPISVQPKNDALCALFCKASNHLRIISA